MRVTRSKRWFSKAGYFTAKRELLSYLLHSSFDSLTLLWMQNDVITLARKLGEQLLAHNYTVTSAESCTGGGLMQAITAIAGSSSWFNSGIVTYSNQAKRDLLGVDSACLETYGAVSPEVVEQMAFGALKLAHANLAVAISGVAGPDGGTVDKPVGTVCFAWVHSDGRLKTATELFQGNRAEVREQAVQRALVGLIALIEVEGTITV